MHIYKWNKFYFFKDKYLGMEIGLLHRYSLNSNTLLKPFRFIASKVRMLFPYFYSIGLRDCDSGGRVFAWYPEWGLNYWHINKRLELWNGAGDGEVYNQIPMVAFIKWHYQTWKDNKQREREY